MQASQKISASEEAWISNFIDQGFGILEIAGFDQLADRLLEEVEQLWQRAPFDISLAGPINGGRPMPMQEGVNLTQRGPGVRLMDIHSHSLAAREMYLHKDLHRICGLLFGAQAIATQSLFFEYGSTQSLHRDPWYVNHSPRTHLLAAWIALEDISPDAGPLLYVPGSHKLPYYRFESSNDIVFHDPRVNPTERNSATAHMAEQMRQTGMKAVPALPKKGQAFFWHGSLIHGGSPVINPALTRRSFVVHFGRTDTHKKRGGSMQIQGQNKTCFTTEQYRGKTGTLGWINPFYGLDPESLAKP